MFKKNTNFLVLLMGMLVYFTACVVQPLYYTVSYETEYGTAPEKITVEENVKLTAEQLPVLSFEGYTFKGWSVNDTIITADSYEVKSDITLVAKWEKIINDASENPEDPDTTPSDGSQNDEVVVTPPTTQPTDPEENPFANIQQLNGMPIISITANYLATSKEDGFEESDVNDFVTKPVAKSVKEQTAGQDWAVEYANAPVPFYKDCKISVLDENGSISLNEVEAEVKVRGNWTTTYKKKPLRIKFKEKQSMLGLNEGNDFKNWVLLASYKDRSFLRDITGFTLGKLISPDYYASDFKLVEVYVNGKYFGVYVLAEQQEVKKKRINIDDAEENPLTDTGYLIEYDRYYEFEDDEVVFELTHGEVKDRNGEVVSEFNNETQKDIAGYTIKNDLSNTAQRDSVKKYMQDLWDACYEAVNTKTEAEAKSIIEQYIDVQSLVDTYILQEIVCDPDLYITSFFMTLDLSSKGNKKLTFQAPWDFDSTMGNKKHDANLQGLFAGVVGYDVNYQRRGTGNPWMMLLVNQSWFNELVKEKWNSIKDSVALKIENQITTLTNKYTANFAKNYKTWPMESNDEYRAEAAACTTQSAAANQLGSWLTARVASLDNGINDFKVKDLSKVETEYIKAESTENGIKIVFTLKDGEDFNYDWSGIREKSTGLKYFFEKTKKQNDGSFEFYFPYVEKDTFYEFTFDGEIKMGEVSNYSVPGFSIKSMYEYKPLGVNVVNILNKFCNNSTTSCEIKDKYYVISNTSNIEIDSVRNTVREEFGIYEKTEWVEKEGSLVEVTVQKDYFYTNYSFVLGAKDWTNTKWLTGGEECTHISTDYVSSNNKEAFSTYWAEVNHVLRYGGYEWKTNGVSSDLYYF